MKNLINKFLLAALAVCIVALAPSCEPNVGGGEGDAITLTVTPSKVNIPAEGSWENVTVTTNAESWDFVNAASWVEVERNADGVVIFAEANNTNSNRKGDIVITAVSGNATKTATIKIEQVAVGGTSSGGELDFECPVFESLMLEAYDVNGDGKISESEAARVTEISVAYTESDAENRDHITSLRGIKMFKNLKYLECENNLIRTLDVSGMEKLELVDCFYNEMTSLDVSNCPSLKWVYCYSNNLTKLHFNGSNNIMFLHAYKNNLTSLDVSGMPELVYFDVRLNDLREVNFSNCPKLQIAAVGNNDLISLDLSGLPNLYTLGCYDNNIASLDLSGLPMLNMLECYANNITKLDLSANTVLASVTCQNNLISELNIDNCPNLRLIDCSSNRLEGTFDLNKFSGLECVSCGGNNFTKIEVSACTKVTDLSCENTSITELNVAPLTALESLIANNCLLTTMDCSNNRALKTLYLQGNPLTSLILANGQSIVDLKIDNYDVIEYK